MIRNLKDGDVPFLEALVSRIFVIFTSECESRIEGWCRKD